MYLSGIGSGQRRLEIPIGLLRRPRPDILISLYASPSFAVGSLLARAAGIRVGYWVEVTFDAWVPRGAAKERLKSWLFPRVHAVLTPGTDGKHFAERYGARPERIFEVPHVIDADRLIAAAQRAQHHREAIRREVGLQGCTFVYVGRLWAAGKGLSYLLKAFASVAHRSAEAVSLLLVGDGPDESRLKQQAVDLGIAHLVQFAGFASPDRLSRLLAGSDVFVFPTLGDPYGLVLDESMASRLPLISTSAVGELHLRIEPGRNGIIVAPADSESLADAMVILAADAALRDRMGSQSQAMIRGRNHAAWVDAFERAVWQMVEMPGKPFPSPSTRT
jgi:glycosyltransferase involved in cell wall biosynthesis